MVGAFCVVVNAFIFAMPALAVVDGGKMSAEIGVDRVDALRDDTDMSRVVSSLIRRDTASLVAQTATKNTTSHSTSHSHAYEEAVQASRPVAYWKLTDRIGNSARADGPACGQDGGIEFGDPCLVDGAIIGNPKLGVTSLISSSTDNLAIEFDGSSHIVIPDSPYINANDTGYPERTVELWFSAGDLGATNRSIFEEGNAPHSGISIFAQTLGAQGAELSMYLWDRGNGEVDFGNALINPDPIRCQFELNKPVYAALVFSGADMSVTGYIKRPNEDVTICGKMSDLPTGALLRHHGHGGGNAIIGGIKGTSRTSGLTVIDDTEQHDFVGSIDEVAIYNRALPQSELAQHVTAAGRATSTED